MTRRPTRVLLTAANRGIGLALASAFVDAGDEVWAAVRATADTTDLDSLGCAGRITLDQGDAESVAAGLDDLAAKIDGLDLLVNCAGIDARSVGADPSRRGPFDLTADAMTEVLRINSVGPMLVTSAALPLLRAGRDPLVVNLSSQLGSLEVGGAMGNDTSYNMSKAALNMWVRRAAAALRSDGIAVVAVHPGWVQTDMGGPSAALTPTESATAMVDTIDGLSLADSGRFLTWDGRDHPW